MHQVKNNSHDLASTVRMSTITILNTKITIESCLFYLRLPLNCLQLASTDEKSRHQKNLKHSSTRLSAITLPYCTQKHVSLCSTAVAQLWVSYD